MMRLSLGRLNGRSETRTLAASFSNSTSRAERSAELGESSVSSTGSNSQVMQDTTTDLLITSIPRLIAYCSTILPLLPGDVIVSGTPGGVGARRNPPVWMRDGDVCEIEISGVGVLRNPIVAEA